MSNGHLDIPAWLRSLRLHKYSSSFAGLRWEQMITLSDQDLIDRGVQAKGARDKMLKIFEQVKHKVTHPQPYSR